MDYTSRWLSDKYRKDREATVDRRQAEDEKTRARAAAEARARIAQAKRR